MEVEDLKKILEEIEKSESSHFIITHGTYTMPDSARFLQAHLKNSKNTIIFTGSMTPMAEFTMSDGGFNLGYAVAKLEALDAGIYVAMNGCVFTPEEVVKIISEGRFTSLFGE